MSDIKWSESIDAAKKEIEGTNKLLFMFFHAHECGGCRKTLNITFKDPDVSELLSRDFAPLNFVVTEAQDMTARFNVEWTPTFIIADRNGVELERWVGYLPPEEFLSQIHLSEGLAELHQQRFKDAENAFEWIIDYHPEAEVAPEARYFMGVTFYKETGDPVHLARTWEAMSKRYPHNVWTKKASAWS